MTTDELTKELREIRHLYEHKVDVGIPRTVLALYRAIYHLEKLAAVEARADFWHKAAMEWKEMYAGQIVADFYPPRMAMEVLLDVQDN